MLNPSSASVQPMNSSLTAPSASLAAVGEALTIGAFESFRNAAHRAGLPLAVINAFADYKSAVDFTLQAHEADAAGNANEVEKLLSWSRNALAEMNRELASLEQS